MAVLVTSFRSGVVCTTRTLPSARTQVVATAELQADGLDNWVDGFRRQARTLSSARSPERATGRHRDYLCSNRTTSRPSSWPPTTSKIPTARLKRAPQARQRGDAGSVGVPWGSEMTAIDDETDTPGSVVVPAEPYRSPVTNDSVLAFVSSAPQNTEHVVVVEANNSARTESFRWSPADSETTILGS